MPTSPRFNYTPGSYPAAEAVVGALAALAALSAAVEAERDACLQIAEQEAEVWADIASDGGQEAARGIANFIRERATSS